MQRSVPGKYGTIVCARPARVNWVLWMATFTVLRPTMRFLPHEHAAMTAALVAKGVDTATVLFVKRRGRLHVELPGRAHAFAFFRRKSTKLDARGKWEDRVDYFIGNAKVEGVGCGWEEVLDAFNAWLRSGDGSVRGR